MTALEYAPTPAAQPVPQLGEEELEERAFELEREAEQHRLLSRSLFGEAAKLRQRAERLREREAELAERRVRGGRKKEELPYDPHDSLIAAATLATEDLGAGFTTNALAEKLRIGRPRAFKLLLAIEAKGLVARMPDDKWRAVDPNETRVRDGARELGRFTVEQLGEHLGMTPDELSYYIEWLLEEQMIAGGGPMYDWCKLGPERVITSRPRNYRLPEKEPPAGTEILSPRGMPVRVVDHGARGQAGSLPGQRHRQKLKDQRREAMEAARAERSARDKAKHGAAGGKRRPRMKKKK